MVSNSFSQKSHKGESTLYVLNVFNVLSVLVFPLSALYEFCPRVVLRSETYYKKKKNGTKLSVRGTKHMKLEA